MGSVSPDIDRRVELADLDACAREPIHIPGSIQPHGALLVLRLDLTIVQAAIGDIGLFSAEQSVAGRTLADVLPPALRPVADRLGAHFTSPQPLSLGISRITDRAFHMAAHRRGDLILLEFEEAETAEPLPFGNLDPLISGFLSDLQAAATVEELGALAAREVRRITGLDRVLVYRFDQDGNGTVIAEDGNGVLPSYLDLRFPASDIPAQARELYRTNRLRLIPDADYRPVPLVPALNPVTGAPLDLSFASLRSVSPVHLEYMRNMGTGASMSVSLLRENRLWGLISCHNGAARRVPYNIRTACDFIGQVLSLQIAAKEQTDFAQRQITARGVQAQLLARMAGEENFVEGLVASTPQLLQLTNAGGAAILFGDHCWRVGDCPPERDVRAIVTWLEREAADDLFVTDSLAAAFPGGERLKEVASGILAASISQIHASYVVWFRPEVIRTVGWGGPPEKTIDETPEGARIHPRKSFEVWKETVRLRSLPWDAAEVDAAQQLRSAIVDIVLRKAEEMAELNEQLVRSNKELEAFSYSVSHDLRAPFRHIVGYAELLKGYEGAQLSERGHRYIDTIVESAVSAGQLVDDLLSFSQMGRATLHPTQVDMNRLVAEVRKRVALDTKDRVIEWRVDDLPPVVGDPTMLRLVVQNLVENAVKFTTGRDPALIEISARIDGDETIFHVRDNGAGFDMAYVGKLFGVFQRLHRVEEFPGTGIGLANVKRIVEQRHGGRVWAEGEVDKGATIFFALPLVGAAR